MYKLLLVINEVYRQQKWMYEQRVNRIDDRIVNIYQPHVRPIKRGKAGAATEFGAKISASLVDGYCFLDRLSWDAYNESGDLKGQAEAITRPPSMPTPSTELEKTSSFARKTASVYPDLH